MTSQAEKRLQKAIDIFAVNAKNLGINARKISNKVQMLLNVLPHVKEAEWEKAVEFHLLECEKMRGAKK
jgi:hypothetical protein